MINLVLLQHAEAAAEHGAEAEPLAWGIFGPAQFVALAMIVVFGVMAWKKVHKAIGAALDDKIAQIRHQLDEAETLRNEAEELKAEYEKKAKSADKERKAMLARARKEADDIVAKAGTDAEALIERRSKMAEEKIAAEERSAVDQLRAVAAEAATQAAAKLIAERHDPKADSKMVSAAIKEIAQG